MPLHYLTDFDAPWCQKIIQDPNAQEFVSPAKRRQPGTPDEESSGTLLKSTLTTPDTVRALKMLRRDTVNCNGQRVPECVMLCSLGSGMNGHPNTLHGGINATILDTLLGSAVVLYNQRACMTGELTVKYKKPIRTPSVILGRGWVEKADGRKVWVRGHLEDENGTVLTAAEGLWIQLKSNVPVEMKLAGKL